MKSVEEIPPGARVGPGATKEVTILPRARRFCSSDTGARQGVLIL